MFCTSVRQTVHRLSSTPILRSTRQHIYPCRGLHMFHVISQTRRVYKRNLKILASASIILGLAFYAIESELVLPYSIIHSDSDEVSPTDTGSDKSEEGKDTHEPPEDFTTNSPLLYNSSFWEPSDLRSLDDLLGFDSHIFSKVDTPCGVCRYDVSVVGNSVRSCFSSASFIEIPTHYWLFFGIYDGHNGNKVSSYISRNLRQSLMDTLTDLYSKHATLPVAHVDLGSVQVNNDYWSGSSCGRPYPPADEFDDAIKQGFIKLDREIVEEAAERGLQAAISHFRGESPKKNELSYQDAAELVSRACCGSSALVAVYESDTRQLHMANTGDSRAVLGRRKIDDKGLEVYEVHVLTSDTAVPSGFIDDPIRRTRDTPHSVHSFGDGPWKWNEETRQQLKNAFPFIVTNEQPSLKASVDPAITTFETQSGDFLVLANQGLWTSLTNEEVVGLVALWLKRYGKTVFGSDWNPEEKDGVDIYDPETSSVVRTFAQVPTSATRDSSRKDIFVKEDLPVQYPCKKDDTFMYRLWRTPKRFVVADKNAAQHLVRNALGGADTDLLEALVRMHIPRSRPYRNDVSVEIVFFG